MTYNRSWKERFLAVGKVGPIDALRAHSASERARAVADRFRHAENLSPFSGGDDAVDAIRHCAWNHDMARNIGVDQAKLVADLHESVSGAIGAEASTRMDYHNNHIGRLISQDPAYRGLTTYDACGRALDEGRLMTTRDLRPGGADGNPNTPW